MWKMNGNGTGTGNDNGKQQSPSIVPDSGIYSIICSWSVERGGNALGHEKGWHITTGIHRIVRYAICIDAHDNAIIWQFKAHRTKHYLHCDLWSTMYKQNCTKTKNQYQLINCCHLHLRVHHPVVLIVLSCVSLHTMAKDLQYNVVYYECQYLIEMQRKRRKEFLLRSSSLLF